MVGIDKPIQLRAIGQCSLSSALKVIVDIAWALSYIALAFVWLISLVSLVSHYNNWNQELEDENIFIQISFQNHSDLASWLIAGTIMCVGLILIMSQLRHVFKTLVAGDPFVPENASRFKNIAFTLAILELARLLIRPTLHFFTKFSLDENSVSDEFALQLSNTNLLTWMAVLVLLVLAQVFHEGAHLREEQQMTI